MKYETLTEACRAWVNEFNQIPYSVIRKLQQVDEDDLMEVTPPTKYDRVYVFEARQYGEILKVKQGDNEKEYLVRIDGGEDDVLLYEDDFEVEHDNYFPMWGTMWAFSYNIDNEWLSGNFGEDGIQAMADCGFRIYESEDYGYVFGIDGCGYNFFEEHWQPLYKARGLHWHEIDDTVKETA